MSTRAVRNLPSAIVLRSTAFAALVSHPGFSLLSTPIGADFHVATSNGLMSPGFPRSAEI